MLKYVQATGNLYKYSKDVPHTWVKIGSGYSGHGEGVNCPEKELVQDVGPIPCGLWSLSFPYKDDHRGPICFRLTPMTYRGPRSGFLLHADNSKGDRSASEGCIIMAHDVRQAVADSKEQYLLVEAAE